MNRHKVELIKAIVRKVIETIDVSEAMEVEVDKLVWLSKLTSGCLADARRDAKAAERIRRPLGRC